MSIRCTKEYIAMHINLIFNSLALVISIEQIRAETLGQPI